MRNLAVFLIALLTVSFVLLVGEISRWKDAQPDYQAYSKRLDQIDEATK